MPEKFTNRITADPSKSSLREEVLDLESTGVEERPTFSNPEAKVRSEVFVDKNTGERFHLIKSDKAKAQKFASLMLKGVINVSDVVEVDGNFYSQEQNLTNVEAGKENVVAEAKVDALILEALFLDNDHRYLPKNHINRKSVEGQGVSSAYEHHNLIIDEVNNKLNFFDFRANMQYLTKAVEDSASIKEDLGYLIEGLLLDQDKNTIVNILRNKVSELAGLFSESEFARFEKIVQKSGVESNDEQQKTLFTNMRLRLEILLQELSKIKES